MSQPTETPCQLSLSVNEFQVPGRAIQETEWVQEPADPTQQDAGKIQKGQLVWFRQEPFGSGPGWQQVRLNDQTLGFVNPHHFTRVEDESTP